MRKTTSANLILVSILGLALAACATYQETLTNAQGQKVTCEAHGKNGIVTGLWLRQGFDHCVHQAQAAGYQQSGQAAPADPDGAGHR